MRRKSNLEPCLLAKGGAWSWAKPGAPAHEQAEAEAKQEESLPIAEMPEELSADQPPVPELRPSAEQGSAPADPARPSLGADQQATATVARPPLQPAPAQTSEVADRAG
jgi:hypothetical protein